MKAPGQQVRCGIALVATARRRAVQSLLLACALLLTPGAPHVMAVEISGYVEAEARGFVRSALHAAQRSELFSLAFAPEFYHGWNDGQHSLRVAPFLRIDSSDPQRSHFDIREALYWRAEDRWELRVGIGKVFWGVTESRHLVDIVNQTDAVENVDGEDKLGQPMLSLTLKANASALELFALPGFRERTFPGPRGRLRSAPAIDHDAARYESSAGDKHIDYALRWSAAYDVVDIGLSYFIGTSRAPRLVASQDPAGKLLLRPHYDQVQRFAVDAQVTTDALLLKLEGVVQAGSGPSRLEWVMGGEYTWFDVGEGGVDVGILAEHLFDGRGRNATHAFQNDLFLGVRMSFNDHANSQLLAGVIHDLHGHGEVLSIEASRRLDDRWRMEIESRIWSGIAARDPQYPVRRDDYVTLRLLRYF